MLGAEDRVSRPNSLVLDGAQPEREPLKFDVQLVGAPPEVEQLVINIKQVAEDFLYHWKIFPIVLPPSRFTAPGSRPSDVIVPPPCDELDAAVLDAGVEPQPLSPKQLHSIREKGEFEVPSRHFPGQTHVWRVAGWLQKGRSRTKLLMQTQLAHAAALLLVVARERLCKDDVCSLPAGVRSCGEALYRLMDLLIGMPFLEARDLEKKIREERSRYLVAELICKPEHSSALPQLSSWVSRASRRRPPPPVPTAYTTPHGLQVDLRLYRREVVRAAAPLLQAALDRESRGWFLHYRDRLANELARQKMPLKEIEEEVSTRGAQQYVSRVCTAVLNCPQLAEMGNGLPQLLAQQLSASAAMERAQSLVVSKLSASLSQAETGVRAAHPVLSLSAHWTRRRLDAAAQRLAEEYRWTALSEAAQSCKKLGLEQHAYFMQRDLVFLRDREPLLAKELRSAPSATRSFSMGGGGPVRAPSTPRARANDTRWAGWRLSNDAYRTCWWGWCLLVSLVAVVPWCSPVSFRTLFYVSPFVPDYRIEIRPKPSNSKRNNEVHTMWSRLLMLWRYVSKERTRFETEPDTGLLGKGLSRQAHRLWNYGVVGGLGSVCLLLVFPCVAVLTSLLSLCLAVLVPILAPLMALVMHLFNAIVYDFDCPDPKKLNRWFVLLEVLVWRLVVLGVVQPALAVITALVICPLCALLWLLLWSVALVSWVWWQWWWWRAVLVRGARVPAHDTAYCRRVRGPGLDAPLCYQITASQAITAVMARAELESLQWWAQRVEAAIDKPLRDYRHFVDACFGPFSVMIAKTGSYKQLEKECAELTASLREKVSARKRELALGLSDAVREKVRMTADDLQSTVRSCGRELPLVLRPDDDWWTARGLPVGDWHALAAHFLLDVFGSGALVALGGRAAVVPLEGGARWDPPPDVLHAAHWDDALVGWSVPLSVRPPLLEVSSFNPRAANMPPLPTPPLVALLLYNRDADSPIPLESEACADAIKGLEDAPDCDDTRAVERYRGGGSSAEGSLSGSSASDEPTEEARLHDPPTCRVSPSRSPAQCRWTLTGRGVRLRADLASPEDVSLDVDRPAMGTSV